MRDLNKFCSLVDNISKNVINNDCSITKLSTSEDNYLKKNVQSLLSSLRTVGDLLDWRNHDRVAYDLSSMIFMIQVCGMQGITHETRILEN